LTEHQAGILLPQSELTPNKLSNELNMLDRRACLEMAEKGHALANRQACQRVADIIWQAL